MENVILGCATKSFKAKQHNLTLIKIELPHGTVPFISLYSHRIRNPRSMLLKANFIPGNHIIDWIRRPELSFHLFRICKARLFVNYLRIYDFYIGPELILTRRNELIRQVVLELTFSHTKTYYQQNNKVGSRLALNQCPQGVNKPTKRTKQFLFLLRKTFK